MGRRREDELAQNVSELATLFDLARQNLASILEHGDDADHLITEADQEMSRVFCQLLTANLTSDDERLKRVDFLLNEIVGACDRDELVCHLSEQITLDLCDARAAHQVAEKEESEESDDAESRAS